MKVIQLTRILVNSLRSALEVTLAFSRISKSCLRLSLLWDATFYGKLRAAPEFWYSECGGYRTVD
jgi:hypothetical protein